MHRNFTLVYVKRKIPVAGDLYDTLVYNFQTGHKYINKLKINKNSDIENKNIS